MKKKVNVYPTIPIMGTNPPILGITYATELSIGDISLCIFARAKVEEILKNGEILPLNLSNYDKDNNKDIVVEKVKQEETIPEPIFIPKQKEEIKIEEEIKQSVEEDNTVSIETKDIPEEEMIVSNKEESIDTGAEQINSVQRNNKSNYKKNR